ncbi:hypothetical protein G9409_06570 [Chlorobium sp. BLA1]|uniref:hypothetical protein n=1 Tax=Candidatus Chlorobium masyuteum TaxID=2716876 RepID=UPI00141F4481|nr:hypothetical protein [Candidatus Chlorobium masyuteum]NHQ60257.1 hypothetical protein [Candidatus Chlorobium masyuteum]
MTIMDEKTRTSLNPAQYSTIGKVAVEKLESIRSKMLDNTATEEDRLLGRLLEEITALAKNRISVTANESDFSKGSDVWVERTEGHFPHIRLHGGALEDDPIKSL